jgi:hypothetical protein
MRVEHHRHAVAFHGDDEVLETALGRRRVPGEVQGRIGEQQLPEPPGIREMGANGLSIENALDHKAVRAGREAGGDDVLEEPHSRTVAEEGMIVTGAGAAAVRKEKFEKK